MAADPFLDWLPEVADDEVLIAPDDIVAEARGNQWSFAVTSQQAAALGTAQVASFVHAVAAARGRWLAVRNAVPMLFYCWHDELAAQLRFSLVSTRHGRLPFGCEVEQAASLDSVVSSFLGSPYHDGIRLIEASESDPASEGEADRPLPVWVARLPSAAA